MADSLRALSIPLEEFLRPFFDAGDTVCLRIFDDKKAGTFKGMKLECAAGKIGTVLDTLHKHNVQGRGIYFVINHGGHEDANITRINAQFVECDDLPIEEQLAQIDKFSLPPSLVVKTKKSLHTYWLMKDAKVEDFRRIQKKLIAHFHGDPACVNESRVFRLPGFFHCKGEPIPVACVRFNPERRYTQAQLEEALPALSDEERAAGQSPKGTRHGLTLVGRRCLFIQHCKENAATLSEADWYAMISNLAVFEGGASAIHTLSRAYPNYSQDETQRKIEHFLRSGTKPMTCAKIAEAGFACPRLQGELCGCKSPAALCFKPMAVEELREMLLTIEASKSTVDNLQTVRTFVTEYLYNVEPLLAEAFINYEIKEHFGFRASDMKVLITLHRDTRKRFFENKDGKWESGGHEIPAWYEPMERGGMRFLPGVLANHIVEDVKAFYGAGSFFFYEKGVYTMKDDLDAYAKVREYMMPRYANMTAISDTGGQWRMLARMPVREINSNPYIINVKNGLYNLLDGSFSEHTPDYISTVQINAVMDEKAKCPQFDGFLRSILGDDDIHLMQEIFGYFLVPIAKAQKAFVFVGAANAGKSTLLSIVQEVLLGSENVSNIPWQSLSDRFKTAELFGKLANIFADLPSKSIDDNGMFKALTGEDYVNAERKNKDPFSFRPYARLLFSCNEIPRNYGDRSEGFYRRLIIVRFNKSVPADKRDPNLKEKLASERDGIFLWALNGLKRLMRNGYQFSETEQSKAELLRYRMPSTSRPVRAPR